MTHAIGPSLPAPSMTGPDGPTSAPGGARAPLPAVPDAPPAVVERERERVVQALSTHYAYDRLTLEAVEERLDRAYRAVSVAQLRSLLADLPATTAEELAAAPGSARLPAAWVPAASVPAASVPERGFALAVMGGFERKGGMVVPRHYKVTAFLGGGVLDLREASFGPGVTEMDVSAIMGGVQVFVPPGVRVECSGAAIMGGFGTDTDDPAGAAADGPVLRLSGFALWGGVDVQTRLVGETEKAYKRRRREERRGLRR
jgi:hypothetical protein